MHWHGISQYGSPFADGTPYASQWPIPPGKYFDYEFQFDDDIDGTLYISLGAILICSWYHSHVGTQSLTCHGALIVAAQCANPANCPCTHVNCGRAGDQVWDPIAGDWSPTIGIDVTVNVEMDWNGGSISVTDSTHVSIGYGNGNNNGNSNGGQGSSNTGSYISGVEYGSSSSGSQSGSSSSGSQGGLSSGSQGESSSESQGSSSSGSQSGSSGSVIEYSSSGSEVSSTNQQDPSHGHKACCKCGCKANNKKKARRGKRGLRKRDSGVSSPPYAFDTSCSKCPIAYDEERIVILEDMFNSQDTTLQQEALYVVCEKLLILLATVNSSVERIIF